MKRFCLFLFAVVLVMAFCPTEWAIAESEEVWVLGTGGEEMSVSSYKLVQSSGEVTEWNSGWYVVSGSGVAIQKRIKVSGTVHLVLRNNSKLYANSGITVGQGATLNIYAESGAGDGTLEANATDASSDQGYAGIGGSLDLDCGTINIYGGKIIAASGVGAAGIGGGTESSGGQICICGGEVNATGQGGAGIGNGKEYSGSGGEIRITGGQINATGRSNAAGIGGGSGGKSGTVSISGGSVTAYGSKNAAGIGGGKDGLGGSLSITGGTVKARSQSGSNLAAIGRGDTGTGFSISLGTGVKLFGNGEGFNSAGTEITSSPGSSSCCFMWTEYHPEPVYSAPTAVSNLIYNGNLQDLLVAGTVTGGAMTYALGADAVTAPAEGYMTSVPQGRDVGRYHVWYKVTGDDGSFEQVATSPLEVEILPRSIEGAEVTLGAALAYTGLEQRQTVHSVVIGGLEATYEVSGNTGTDLGTYTLTVSGTGNFTGSATREWTIGKGAGSLRFNEASVSRTYGDEPFTIALSHSGDGQVTYGSDNPQVVSVDSVTGVVTVLGAGEATVTATVADSELYTYAQNTATCKVNISKADQTAPAAPQCESVTISSVVLEAMDGYQYSMDGGEWQDSPVFAGLTKNTEYLFCQRLAEAANHFASPASGETAIRTLDHIHAWSYTGQGNTLTVTCTNADGGHEGDLSGTWTIQAPEHTACGDGMSAEAVVSDGIAGIPAPSVVYSAEGEILSAAPEGAGTYTASIRAGEAVASVTYTVRKGTGHFIVSMENGTYGTSLAQPSYDRPETEGTETVTYSGTTWSGAAYGPSGNAPVEAGEYTVFISFETAEAIWTGDKAFSIAKRVISGAAVTLSQASVDYSGTEQQITVTEVKLDGQTLAAGTDYETGTGFSGSACGEYTAEVIGKGNYVGSATAAWRIVPAQPVVESLPVAAAITYGQKLGDSTLTGGMVKLGEMEIPGTFSWQDATILPNVPESGSQEYAVVFSPEDAVNIQLVTVNVPLTVNCAECAAVPPEKRTGLVYSGSAQPLVMAGSADGGEMVYAVTAEEGMPENWSDALPTGLEAGRYFVWYKVLGDANHQDIPAANTEVSISRRPVTVSGIRAKDKYYDGNILAELDFGEAVISGNVDGNRLNVTAEGTFADAGVGTDKPVTLSALQLGGAAAGNYVLAEEGQQCSASADILENRLELDASGYSGTYDGLAHTISVLTTEEDVTVTYSDRADGAYGPVPPEYIEAGTWTVYFRAEKTGWATVADARDVIISRRAVTVRANDQQIALNGAIDSAVGKATLTGALEGHHLSAVSLVGSSTENATETGTITPEGAVIRNEAGEEVTGNYEIRYEAGTLTVLPGQGTVIRSPEANILTYTGKEQPLVSPGEANTSMEYSLDGVAYSGEVPGAVQAGTYSVFCRAAGDSNHSAGEPEQVSVEIRRAKLTVTAKASEMIYGDAPVAGGVEYAGFVNEETEADLSGELVYSFDYQQYGDVGIYTVTPSGLTAGNYEIAFVPGEMKVRQKEIGLNWSNTDLTYDGTAQMPAAEAAGVVNEDGIAVSVTVNGEHTASGEYMAEAVGLTGEKAGNYALPEQRTAKFTIRRAPSGISRVPVANSHVYNGREERLLLDMGEAVHGEMKYVLSDDGENAPEPETYFDEEIYATEAGVYYIWYMVEGEENYTDYYAEEPVEIVIGRKDISGAEVTLGEKLIYNGAEQTQTVESVIIDGLHATFEVSGNRATDPRTDGDYALTVTGTWSFTGTITVPWNIEKANEPDQPESPDTPDTPNNPDTPETPDTPDTPNVPDTPETPDTPDTPNVPDTPDTPDAPDAPSVPDTPETPDAPDAPNMPDTPETPDTPDAPNVPNAPEIQNTPEMNEAGQVDESSAQPPTPQTDGNDNPDAGLPEKPEADRGGDPDNPDLPSGLVLNPTDGHWYFMNQGNVLWEHSGFAMYGGEWFMITHGMLDENANGLYPYNGGTFVFAAGMLKTQINGLWMNLDEKWYFVANGQVATEYTGLAMYNDAWFYVVEGALADEYTGIVEYGEAQFYVIRGQLAVWYSGVWEENGKEYNISYGQVV